MITELYTVSNRRIWPRVNQQVPVQAGSVAGMTLNVSLQGARIVTAQPLDQRFRLLLQLDETIEVEAERVWQEKLGTRSQVAGVRFVPEPHQQSLIQSWMDRMAS